MRIWTRPTSPSGVVAPRQRREYRRPARNDDTDDGRKRFVSMLKHSPVEPKHTKYHWSTTDDANRTLSCLFSPHFHSIVMERNVRTKSCQLPNLDIPPTSIGGTLATSRPQLQPHHPPPFPQAPFFRVSRRGSRHDFHSLFFVS